MTKKKNIRAKGKIQLSEYFKKYKTGDSVAVIQERSLPSYFPKKIIGMTGKIEGTKGTHYIIGLKDGGLSKQYTVHPLNLKKVK